MNNNISNLSKSTNSNNLFFRAYSTVSITLKKLIHIEAFAGILLLIAAATALIWANFSHHNSYANFWHTNFGFTLGSFTVIWDLHFWINDVLMTLFFLSAGLEVRKEIHDGALSSIKHASLPIFAAIGGVVIPALIYISFNHDPTRHSGWAVPTATDIAFAIGILALLGRSLPSNIRVILLSLAIIDDIIAVLIIALFYSNGLDGSGVIFALAAIVLIFILQYCGVGSLFIYAIPATLLWFGLWKTGIHPSLSGVILGFLTPITYHPLHIDKGYNAVRKTTSPSHTIQNFIHPWVTFFIMPIFALANAGIYFGDSNLSGNGTLWIAIGVGAGLVIGKPLGIVLTSFIMVKIGLCRLPSRVNWSAMILIGVLSGIGFTMSIFVAMLAFSNPDQLISAKLGVLIGSTLSAIFGLLYGLSYLKNLKKHSKNLS